MFGLFKKKPEPQPQVAEEKPYEPEKPVRELFEAVKDCAESFSHENNIGDLVYAIKFEFMGKRFGAFAIHLTFWCETVTLINDGFDKDEFNWLSQRELHWLFFKIKSHLNDKEHARRKAKRQEFIDALCPDDP